MQTSAIINHLDEFFKSVCQENKGYQVFRIGSSVFETLMPIHDIDYLLINENSPVDFGEKILNLKREFSGPNFLKAAVNTFDPYLDEKLQTEEEEIRLKFGQSTAHAFGFGPIVMPEDPSLLILHLAGPMNVVSTNIFFEQFPLFHLIFSRFYLPLGTKDFSELIKARDIGEADIREEYTRIYTRAKNIDNVKIKRQALKRLKLVELTLQNHPNPYLESYQQTVNLSLEEITEALKLYTP